ncbi:hypothetical protein BYT27DRAFT_7092471 [Phlegmacium glaucopus]|nr:hypothetical protein BYT27DRAFT_7092471 [Phlegmacium glaucopus]
MTDITNCSFTGKPEDQDPQDFMNKLKCMILMKTGLTEPEKVRFFQLSLKAKPPATAWFSTLQTMDKVSFVTIRAAFELQWPEKPITEKTTAEKQALLDGTTLKPSDLGKRVAASMGADRIERLAGDIPDTNNLLVASTQKKLPKALQKLVGLKSMTWKQLADTIRSITLEEIMEKIEEEWDLARYTPAIPNTPSKSLRAAFQNINLSLKIQHSYNPSQYQPQRSQLIPQPSLSTFINRPAHEQLADVLNKVPPIQPNNPEGLARYNIQVATWQSTYGQNGKGLSETRLYPLTPGTVPVASGKCWTCGLQHHPVPCAQPAVPAFEARWQSITQTIRKRAEATAATPINVNMVATESDEIQMYDADELAHLQRLANQGKGEGSSM